MDFHRLDTERDLAVLRKHRGDDVDNDISGHRQPCHVLVGLKYSLVRSFAVVSTKMLVVLPGTILETARVSRISYPEYLLTLGVDDRRHREYMVLAIIDDGVCWGITNQR